MGRGEPVRRIHGRRLPRCALTLFALAACLAPATARATSCEPGLEANWSALERQAWATLSAGSAFDTASAAKALAAEPILSAEFLRDVLTCERLVQALPDRSAAFRRTQFSGALDLSRQTVLARLDCRGCLFDSILAVESAWHESISLGETAIRGVADFWLARLSSSLTLRNSRVDDILDLTGAEIGGDLVIADGTRLGALSANSANIARSLEIRGAEIVDYVDLWGVQIAQDLLMLGSETAPTVIGSGVAIAELAQLAPDAPPVLSLGSARIGRRISIADTRINGKLDLDAVRVTEDLWLRDCSIVAGPINLVFARIGQNVDFSSTVLTDVDLTGGRIGGELRLGAPSGGLTAPVWKPGGSLRLRNVEVSSWTDATGNPTPRATGCLAPPGTPDPWPDDIDVIGFSYQNVGGFGGGATVAEHDVDWFCRWLARQTVYSFEPYQHAAAYLRRVGLEEDAEDVLYCGKTLQIENTDSWGGRFALQVQRAFVGFGYKVERSLLWAALFVLVGQQVFSRTHEAKARRMTVGLAYSIDMFVPGLSLRGMHREIDLAGWQRYYFYLHKFMGWVLGSFVVASLVGVLGD